MILVSACLLGQKVKYDGGDNLQELLKAARKSALYPRIKRDMVIAWCIHHRCSVTQCQEALQQYGLPLLGEGNRNA